MAVQQNKVSKSRRNNRRAHDSLVAANPNECDNCGEMKRPHHVCPSCGHYATREVVATTTEVIIAGVEHKGTANNVVVTPEVHLHVFHVD